MQFLRKIPFMIMVSIIMLIADSSHASDDGDIQFWNTDGIEFNISDKLRCGVEEELRFGDDPTRLYHIHTDGGLTIKVTDELDIGVRYRFVHEKEKGSWKEENRPYANATLKGELFGFKLKDRNQLELRIPEEKNEKWRYRNKFTMAYSLELCGIDIEPYFADEIFVDFSGEKFNRNRLYSGFSLKPFKYIKTEFYYLWQLSKEKSTWTGINVIGLKAKALF